MKKFILAFFVLVLLGGGIAGGVLMALDSSFFEKEVVLHAKFVYVSGPSFECISGAFVDPGLVANAATGCVVDVFE